MGTAGLRPAASPQKLFLRKTIQNGTAFIHEKDGFPERAEGQGAKAREPKPGAKAQGASQGAGCPAAGKVPRGRWPEFFPKGADPAGFP